MLFKKKIVKFYNIFFLEI